MASALPSVPVPYDQPLRDMMRDWSPDDLRRALDHVQDADEARHWLRAYLADRPREWLLLVFGEQFVGSLATEAHLALIRSIGEVMPYKLGRSAPPIALEEPRGFGKSTLSRYLCMHRGLYGKELGIASFYRIQSDTLQASKDLRALIPWDGGDVATYQETPLGQLFPEARRTGTIGQWWMVTDYHRTPMWFRTFGGTIRGLLAEGRRPTFLTLDDLDTDEAVRSAMRRDENAKKLAGAVRGLGPQGGGLAVALIGTRVSDDGLTARAVKDPGWTTARFSVWVTRPTNGDLWEECRRIWANLRLPGPEARERAALAYYEEHRADMDEGAKMLDPDRWTIFKLHTEEWSLGQRAFAQEYENRIIDSSDKLLPMHRADRATLRGRSLVWVESPDTDTRREVVVSLSDCEVAIWMDPRGSEQMKSNDFCAVSMVARDPDGFLYEVSTRIERCSFREQQVMLWAMVDFAERLGVEYLRVGYEGNNGAASWREDFEEERRARADRGSLAPRVHIVASTGNKMNRIGALDPVIYNGHLKFCSTDIEVLDQWRDLPRGKHDDAPDATERAIWLLDAPLPDEEDGLDFMLSNAPKSF